VISQALQRASDDWCTGTITRT